MGTLLPIWPVWRSLFGEERHLPLWLGYVPGHAFAVSRQAALRQPTHPPPAPHADGWQAEVGAERGAERASAFYHRALQECGLGTALDAEVADVFERLWRHIFVPPDADADSDSSDSEGSYV